MQNPRPSDCRVYVSMQPETFELVGRLAKLTTRSRSAIIAAILEANKDMLAQLVRLMATAKSTADHMTPSERVQFSLALDNLNIEASEMLSTIQENLDKANMIMPKEVLPRRAARSRVSG